MNLTEDEREDIEDALERMERASRLCKRHSTGVP